MFDDHSLADFKEDTKVSVKHTIDDIGCPNHPRNNSAIIIFNTRSTLSLRLSKNFHALDFVASLVEELTINFQQNGR